MNSVRSNNISLKYQKFTTFGSKDIGIIESEFVAKTQFLYTQNWYLQKADIFKFLISSKSWYLLKVGMFKKLISLKKLIYLKSW